MRFNEFREGRGQNNSSKKLLEKYLDIRKTIEYCTHHLNHSIFVFSLLVYLGWGSDEQSEEFNPETRLCSQGIRMGFFISF
jgi:hypothetical protein